jgi:HEAT repeat protein
MATQPFFAALLAGGDRRSIGQSQTVVDAVLAQPERLAELLALLEHPDPLVRMRAADSAEKVTRDRPQLLRPFTALLLRQLATATQQEMRWHLAQLLPRLALTPDERREAVTRLRGYLTDSSRIVRACALEALAELARSDETLWPEMMTLIRDEVDADSPAVRARARRLLGAFDGAHARTPKTRPCPIQPDGRLG